MADNAMVDEKLAESVRKFQILYDKSSKDFKNKHNKESAFENVVKEVSLIDLDFRTGSTFEQAGLYVFKVCRISCLDILITNDDSGLSGKRSGVRFLCNEHKSGQKKIHSTHAYMLNLMSQPSSLTHKLLMLMLVLMLASLVRTGLK